MDGGTNARDGAPYEPAPQDPSRDAANHRVPAPDFEADPSATADAQLATTPVEAPWQFPGDVPTLLSPGGHTLGGPPLDPSARDTDPRQATPAGDRLQSPLPPALSTSPRNDNNPFLKMMTHKSTASVGNPNSQSADELFGQMSLNEPSNNPWATVASHGTGSSSVYDQSSGGSTGPWSGEPLQQSNTNSGPRQSASPAQGGEGELLVFDNEPSNAGNDANGETRNVSSGEPAAVGHTSGVGLHDEVARPIRPNETSEGSNLTDRDPRRGDAEATGKHGLVEATSTPNEPTASRHSQRSPPLGDDQTAPVPPPRVPTREATEMYHIVRISWHDHGAQHNPRTSPILVQNANGPCPIVALVNALILATPADATDTPLTQALLSREQISIDLLLQAVVEELTGSPRRPSDAVLPDLVDLYNFLRELDTGMNANPRFVPSEEPPDFLREWLADLTPSERRDSIPGGFEQTREMELYSTFSIPLVHGWLPSSSDMVYESMKRRAESYEEAHDLLFQEEELQKKLEDPESSGLTPEEQSIYQDILIIKDFLHASATQLTATGLDILKKAMPPGSVAILFRNDHFSTLYKHPETHGLQMLVTDSEFAGHEGTVWETFDDITGKSEFLSGDFRPIRGAAGQRAAGDRGSSARLSSGSHPGGASSANGGHAAEPQRSPNLEQEDQDFAMALQLQEEEDERHRREQQAARQREQRLSGQYMDPQGRHPPQPPQVPGRLSTSDPRTGLRRPGRPASAQQVRPLVPPASGSPAGRPAVRRAADGGSGEAPPSYDESANDTPFRPSVGHPSHPASAPSAAASPAAAQASPSPQAYQGARPANLPALPGAANAAWYGNSPRPARRPATAAAAVAAAMGGRERDRDRDCTVM